jgi:hypothetical protein
MTLYQGLNVDELEWLREKFVNGWGTEAKVMEPMLKSGHLNNHWPALREVLKSVQDPSSVNYHPTPAIIQRSAKLLKTWFPSATEKELHRLLKKTSISTLNLVLRSYCLTKEFYPLSKEEPTS